MNKQHAFQMSSSSNYKLIITLVIAVLVSASIYLDAIDNELFKLFKPLTTISIIAYTMLYGIRSERYFKFVLIGLGFCLLGDILLLYEAYFIFGLIAFLIAHILFLLGFNSMGGFKIYPTPLVALSTIGIVFYYFLFNSLGELKIPVLAYIVIIVLMSWQGVNRRLLFNQSKYSFIAFAVILFMLSDSILAWAKFKFSFPYSGLLVLLTYWMSIFLIAHSTTIKDQYLSPADPKY